MTNYNTSSGRSIKSYDDMLAEIQMLNSEFARFESVMTVYERAKAREVIAQKQADYRDAVSAIAVERHKAAVNDLKAALEAVQSERRKIAKTWDYGKLADELQVARMRIDTAAKADIGQFDTGAVNRIIEDAELSGDKHRIRAVHEALLDLVSKVPAGSQDPHGNDARMTAHRISRQALKRLDELNNSEGLQKAHEAVPQAVEALNRSKGAIFTAAEILGDCLPGAAIVHNSALDNALHMVDQDQSGDFIFSDPAGA